MIGTFHPIRLDKLCLAHQRPQSVIKVTFFITDFIQSKKWRVLRRNVEIQMNKLKTSPCGSAPLREPENRPVCQADQFVTISHYKPGLI
jgi:hypothetical protein